MPFNSYRYALFAAIVVMAYNVVPARSRPTLLLSASIIFYAASSMPHLLLLCVIIAATYGGGRLIARRPARINVAVSIVAIALPLAAFKSYAFLMNRAAGGGGIDVPSIRTVALPLGISFVTFHAIAYLVDVYRGVIRAEPRFDRVALYLAFFPKLPAGPIERARELMPQLQCLVPSAGSNIYVGLKYALWGCFCKLVVADNVGAIVDAVLQAPQQESGATFLAGFTLYAFQIYFDFLGYTNIAIGVARCFNVELNKNFDMPYAAISLREFWRRWHISLSSWFRDYVYLPLGGNATRGMTRLGQLMAVFLLSGLWHGGALHFVLWGGFHGAAYWTEERLRSWMPVPAWRERSPLYVLQRTVQRLLTFGVVTLGWVFFRVSELSTIRLILERVSFLDNHVAYASLNAALMRIDTRFFVLILMTAILLDSSRLFRAALERVPESSRHVVADLAYVNWFAVTLVLLGDLGVRDFTYAGF